jgi:hypothetical protein
MLPPSEHFNPIAGNALSLPVKKVVIDASLALIRLLNPFALGLANEGVNSLTLNEKNFNRLIEVIEAGPKLPALLLEHAKGAPETTKALTEAFIKLTGTKTLKEAQAVLQTRLNTIPNAPNGNGNLTALEARYGLHLTLQALQSEPALHSEPEDLEGPILDNNLQTIIEATMDYVFGELTFCKTMTPPLFSGLIK